MRRITLAFMATLATLVLLFSYRTSTSGPRVGTSTIAGAAPAGVVPDGAAAGGAGSNSGTGSGSAGTKKLANATVNGPAVDTRWGPVQVAVVIRSSKIEDVRVLVYPTGEHRDEEINSYALPILHDEVIAAQSANIDTVSGATVTSDGYIQSLQAALDAAHFSS